MTQTKHKNSQTVETKDACFCEESFIDRSFLVLDILKEALCALMATQTKKAHGE